MATVESDDVVLTDGRRLAADVVVVAVGVGRSTGSGSGLDLDRAVVVDEHLAATPNAVAVGRSSIVVTAIQADDAIRTLG